MHAMILTQVVPSYEKMVINDNNGGLQIWQNLTSHDKKLSTLSVFFYLSHLESCLTLFTIRENLLNFSQYIR